MSAHTTTATRTRSTNACLALVHQGRTPRPIRTAMATGSKPGPVRVAALASAPTTSPTRQQSMKGSLANLPRNRHPADQRAKLKVKLKVNLKVKHINTEMRMVTRRRSTPAKTSLVSAPTTTRTRTKSTRGCLAPEHQNHLDIKFTSCV